jgi:hypothetical protein
VKGAAHEVSGLSARLLKPSFAAVLVETKIRHPFDLDFAIWPASGGHAVCLAGVGRKNHLGTWRVDLQVGVPAFDPGKQFHSVCGHIVFGSELLVCAVFDVRGQISRPHEGNPRSEAAFALALRPLLAAPLGANRLALSTDLFGGRQEFV